MDIILTDYVIFGGNDDQKTIFEKGKTYNYFRFFDNFCGHRGSQSFVKRAVCRSGFTK